MSIKLHKLTKMLNNQQLYQHDELNRQQLSFNVLWLGFGL